MAYYKKIRRPEFEMMVHVDDAQIFTTVTICAPSGRFTGVGVAKRNPRDTFDMQVGMDIAAGRAMRELADETERNAGL